MISDWITLKFVTDNSVIFCQKFDVISYVTSHWVMCEFTQLVTLWFETKQKLFIENKQESWLELHSNFKIVI